MSVSKCEKGLWNVSRGFFLSYRPLRKPNWYFTIFIAGKNILKFLIRYYIKIILNADLIIILYSPWDFSIRFHSFFLWKLAFEWLTKSDKNDHKTAPTEAFLIRTAGWKCHEQMIFGTDLRMIFRFQSAISYLKNSLSIL